MNKRRIGLYALLSVALCFAVTEPALAQSANAELINELNGKLLYVAIPISLLVEVILIYTVWRFAGNDDPKPTRENRRLEITWTVATAIILLFVGIAAFTILGSGYIAQVPDNAGSAQAQQQIQPQVSSNKPGATAPTEPDAVQIEVIAYQWGWEFRYPAANANSSSELALPTNTEVYFHITSRDVIHAVHVPTLGLKQDAIPGQYNTIKTNVSEAGTYQLYCAEYCGSGHSRMLANVTAMPQGQYQQWLDEQSQSGSNSSSGGNSSAMAAPAPVARPS